MKNYFVEDIIEEESEHFDYNDSSRKRSLIVSRIMKSSEKKENMGSIFNCTLNNQNLNSIFFQKMSDSLVNSINTIKSFNNSSNKRPR